MTAIRFSASVAFVACASISMAQSGLRPPSNHRNFVACPIVRDTKTVPCWLAESNGQTYYLGIQQDISADVYPPQLGHRVLVEGVVKPGPALCGGDVLSPVHVSPLPEIDRACSTVLPAEDGIDAPPASRGPGPAATHAGPRTYAGPPTDGPTVVIPFDFDSDFLPLRNTTALERLATRLRASKKARLEVVGYRATTLLSNGQRLTEVAGIAERRAAKIGGMLKDLHVAESVAIRAVEAPERANGVDDPNRRRVVIRVLAK